MGSIESEINLLSNALKLKTVHEYKEYVSEDASFEENLLKLLKVEADIQNRHSIQRRIKQAGFPILKTIDTFEFDTKRLPHLKKDTIMNLLDFEFIENKTNICAIGPPGTGKTHIVTAIALEAIQKGYSVKFRRASELVIQLREAESEKRLGSLLKTLHTCRLLVLDEMGYMTLDQKSSNLLFQVLAGRYEVNSTIITSNLEFSKWPGFIGDPLMATALVDRLIHRSTILNMNGLGYRILDTKKSKIENNS